MQRIAVEKENAIHTWLTDILAGVTVIWANEGGKRPATPFSTLNIISGPRSVGPAEERYKSEDTYSYSMRKVCTLSVQVFADDALVKANDIVNALELPSKQSLLQGAGIAVWGNTEPRDITALLDTRFEPRATMDIYLAWGEDVEDTLGEIRSVHVAGTINNFETENLIEVGE